MVTFTALQPSFISTAKPLAGSRRTGPSTRAFPEQRVMSPCETLTRAREKRPSRYCAGGVNRRPNESRKQHANTNTKRNGRTAIARGLDAPAGPPDGGMNDLELEGAVAGGSERMNSIDIPAGKAG
jgi:hypothetical protein